MRVILVGASGAMGKTLQNLVEKTDNDVELVALFQEEKDENSSIPVFNAFNALAEANIQADVLIDFSVASLTESLLDYLVQTKTPAVIATTGHSDEQIAKINEASKEVAIIYTQNTSIGVTVMQAAIKLLTKQLYPLGYDIEIIEKHHRYKVDAPSGTARLMLNSAKSQIEEETDEKYGREGISEPRKHNDIGMHSVRAGNIVGEHTIMFAANEEVLELTHKAGNKDLFASGALRSAEFLVGKENGLYSMEDVLGI